MKDNKEIDVIDLIGSEARKLLENQIEEYEVDEEQFFEEYNKLLENIEQEALNDLIEEEKKDKIIVVMDPIKNTYKSHNPPLSMRIYNGKDIQDITFKMLTDEEETR